MRLKADDPDFGKYLVFLNNKWVRGALAADDEEGWVEVPDIAAISPLNVLETKTVECEDGTTKEIPSKYENQVDPSLDEEEVDKWEEMPTLCKHGTVTFKKI